MFGLIIGHFNFACIFLIPFFFYKSLLYNSTHNFAEMSSAQYAFLINYLFSLNFIIVPVGDKESCASRTRHLLKIEHFPILLRPILFHILQSC